MKKIVSIFVSILLFIIPLSSVYAVQDENNLFVIEGRLVNNYTGEVRNVAINRVNNRLKRAPSNDTEDKMEYVANLYIPKSNAKMTDEDTDPTISCKINMWITYDKRAANGGGYDYLLTGFGGKRTMLDSKVIVDDHTVWYMCEDKLHGNQHGVINNVPKEYSYRTNFNKYVYEYGYTELGQLGELTLSRNGGSSWTFEYEIKKFSRDLPV